MRHRIVAVLAVLALAAVPTAAAVGDAEENLVPPVNPVATDEATYQLYGRVFSDPQGCLRHGDQPPDGTPVSPWAKGNACMIDYLSYTETLEGMRFLARRFPDLVKVIRLDQAYDNPDYVSAGIARAVANEDGDVKVLGRDRSPLYLYKITDQNSDVPEEDRLHFAFAMAIHGLERAGLEGGVRAAEDLVTWAACEQENDRAASTPACASEGPFPKDIIESETERDVPTAGEVLRDSVIYFFPPNPDGWRYGEKRAAEFRDGSLNTNFVFGPSHSRYNGHGVDLNRDWPTFGYTLKSHQPWSEPETRAFGEVFLEIKDRTSAGHFAGGIDLHGMLDASAFSYTLLGADQRDYRKNEITVETSLRTWEDQTQRLRWSPYIGDSTGDGQQDRQAVIPVADQWGTVFDTLGYTVTGALGFWMDDSRVGLGAVGINNEMALSHIAPNNVFEPALIQTHIDGNKGLIYSQVAALLFEQPVSFEPGGAVGYVHNPVRITNDGSERPQNPGLPSQNDMDFVFPCRNDLAPQVPGSCGDGTFSQSGTSLTYEFDVLGPEDGFWNGGMTVTSTAAPQFVGHQVYVHAGVILERFDEVESDWVVVKSLSRTHTTFNDPLPGRWRLRMGAANPSLPRRVEIRFDRVTAEEDPGQLPVDASNMDFYTELNDYVPEGQQLEAVAIADLLADPLALDRFDSLLVTNNLGHRDYLRDQVGLSAGQIDAYFAALDGFATRGGNLALTDAAVNTLAELGLVAPADVRGLSGLAGFYGFNITGDVYTYEDSATWPLATGIDLPGAAEQTPGNRQAVEPATLGFSPSGAGHAQMPFWGMNRPAWEALCDKEQPAQCTTATTARRGSIANLGEVGHGDGVIRIAGALLPEPNPVNDNTADHRFGLGSHALTYTAYIVFENLIDYRR